MSQVFRTVEVETLKEIEALLKDIQSTNRSTRSRESKMYHARIAKERVDNLKLKIERLLK